MARYFDDAHFDDERFDLLHTDGIYEVDAYWHKAQRPPRYAMLSLLGHTAAA